MLSKFKITSLGDSNLTTRLGHNRKQNRTELIPLTEIYMNVKQHLERKMQHDSIVIELNAAMAQLHKKCDFANFTLIFSFKLNSDVFEMLPFRVHVA